MVNAQAQNVPIQGQLALAQTQRVNLENQQIQRGLRDQEIYRQAISDSMNSPATPGPQGSTPTAKSPSPFQDPVGFSMDLARRGASGSFVQNMMAQGLATRKALLGMPAEELAAEDAKLVPVQRLLEGVSQLPQEQQPQAYQTALQQIGQIDPHAASSLPGQYSPQGLSTALAQAGALKQHLDMLSTQAEATSRTGAAAQSQSEAALNAVKTKLEQNKIDLYNTLMKNPQALAQRVASSIDPQKYPDEYRRALTEAQAAPDLEGISGVISKHSQNVSEQEKSIATETNPQVLAARTRVAVSTAQAEAPTRIGEAAAIGRANAQSQAQQEATRTILQSQNNVSSLQSTGQQLKSLLATAQGGGPDAAAAAQSFKTMYPLFQIATQGSHRLVGDMTTELPGSALDKLGAIANGLTSGVKMTDAQFKGAGNVIDQVVGGAARAHNAAADLYGKQYGLKFDHVSDPSSSAPATEVKTKADYDKLPSGTQFTWNGQTATKR